MGCSDCQSHKKGLVVLVGRLIGTLVPYVLFFQWAAVLVNRLYLLFSGSVATMPIAQALSATPVVSPVVRVTVPLPDPIAEAYVTCIVVSILIYVGLSYVCRSEWVQEPTQIKECWEEVSWKKPWKIFQALVCTVVETLKWVLKQICEWKEIFAIALAVICAIVVTVIILA